MFQQRSNGTNGNSSGLREWTVGLVGPEGYLTAEKFGFKVNASGASMRLKQTWTLEQSPSDESVFLRSNLNRFLATDRRGNVTCEEEERGEETRWTMEYASDGSGRWSFKSVPHGTYLAAGEESLAANNKTAGRNELWSPHLGIHPQVNLKNISRKKYAHLGDDELQCNELIPWGRDSLVTVEFNGSKYMFRASNGQYLSNNGSLCGSASGDTQFTLEIRTGGTYKGLAFRSARGQYLTASGARGTLKCVRSNVTRDEIFGLEDSAPQVSLLAPNGKIVSIKQGIDVSANQTEDIEDQEIFQMEYDASSRTYSFRTNDLKYFTLSGAGIQATANEKSQSTQFGLEWLPDGGVQIRASNGGYLTAKKTGHLISSSGAPEIFYLTIINRPLLVLKSDFGFVGFKTSSSSKLECNKSVWDTLELEPATGKPGHYFLKGRGRFVAPTPGGVCAESGTAEPWILELHQRTRLALKCPGKGYMKGEQNGLLSMSSDLTKAGLWEY